MLRRTFFKFVGAGIATCLYPWSASKSTPKIPVTALRPTTCKCYWKPGAIGAWDDPKNWRDSQVPKNGDDVYMIGGGTMIEGLNKHNLRLNSLIIHGTPACIANCQVGYDFSVYTNNSYA